MGFCPIFVFDVPVLVGFGPVSSFWAVATMRLVSCQMSSELKKSFVERCVEMNEASSRYRL
jgi:hypothetical protein